MRKIQRPSVRKSAATLLGCTFAAALIVACGGGDDRGADRILRNGVVHTMDAQRTKADAIAIRDGRIVYVGNAAGAESFRRDNTKVEDLQGRSVLPGFVDGHNHAYLRAEAMYWVSLAAPNTIANYKQLTQDYRARNPGLKQVRGVGWSLNFVLAEATAQGKLPRELLDEIAGTDLPAVYITNGHHEVWANTRAMQAAGITRDTPNPPGAFIDRDAVTGEPTGILREFGAQNLVISKLPQPDFTQDEYSRSILSFQEELAPQRGVTSVLVPVHYPTESYLQAIQALDRDKRLTVRYSLALWADETRGTEQVPQLLALRNKYQGQDFKIDTIKIFGTGASSTFGSVVWDQEVLKKTAAALDKEKMRLYIHDIGPTSTYELMLDAIEYATQQNGARDARHTITHVSANASPVAARFKALNVIADGHPTPKAFYDIGARFTSSSDYPVRDFYPMVRVGAGVQSGIPLDTMLASHTIDAAYMLFSEKDTGSLEVGKQADIVVMDKNLTTMPADTLAQAKAVLTLFAGREVFRDASMGAPTAAKLLQVTEQDDHGH